MSKDAWCWKKNKGVWITVAVACLAVVGLICEPAEPPAVRVKTLFDTVCYEDFGDVFRASKTGDEWKWRKIEAREAILIPANREMKVSRVLPGNKFCRIYGVRWHNKEWFAYESCFSEVSPGARR